MTSFFSPIISPLAVDLTAASAPRALARQRDPETEGFIISRLAGLVKLLDRAGADLISLGDTFRLGGKKRRDDYLDGARALCALGREISSARLVASIPTGVVSAQLIAGSVGAIHKATGGLGGWQVDAPTPEPTGQIATVAAQLTKLAAPTAVVINVRNDVDIEIAAARATVARLRVNTVEEARTLRSAIQAAALDWGRRPDEISVLVDVHTVLAPTTADAQARALFLEDLDTEGAHGLLRHVGTAAALATVWQNWVRAGGADGFTLLPASIPTDIVHIAGSLLPELEQRGLRAATPVAAPVRTQLRAAKQPVAV